MLGSTVFQSFIGGIVAYRALPRSQFSTLQKNIFPPYFMLQTLAPLAMWLTYPRSLVSAFTNTSTSNTLTAASNDKLNAYLISTMFVTALLNLIYVGPQTTEVMRLRKHQETRDGKKSYDAGPHSEEMKGLNTRFGVLHGVSSAINMVGFGAMVWYGGVLGEGVRI
jgi:hypothetical protein